MSTRQVPSEPQEEKWTEAVGDRAEAPLIWLGSPSLSGQPPQERRLGEATVEGNRATHPIPAPVSNSTLPLKLRTAAVI